MKPKINPETPDKRVPDKRVLGKPVQEAPDALVRLDAGGAVRGSAKPLFGLDANGLAAVMTEAGEPAWRGRQLAEAIYRQRVAEISQITTLPKPLRAQLESKGWQVGRPEIAQVFRSVDGTERYLVRGLGEGQETVETVWMPEGDDGEAGDGSEMDVEASTAPSTGKDAGWKRATICVSSQVGCAVNCQFCLTAKLGLQRNLTAGEIAGQLVAVFERHAVEVGSARVNLVFMGMGEPFLNYEPFMAAVRLLVEEVGLSPQRMTVSTSGIVPGIEQFALEPPEVRPKLAISLNAPNDKIRNEYVLLGGVTDRVEHAREVARLVRRTGLPAKVNLIAWNPGPGIEYVMPQADAVEAFRTVLGAEGIAAYVRRPRGRDIYAACGQLKGTVEERGPGNRD